MGRHFLAATRRQPLDLVEELFENEHVRLLMLFKISLFGTWLTDTLSKTSPMGSVIRAFDLQTGYQLCQGGSFNLARGLMEAFIAAGGTYQPQAHVARIVIEGGRATGIALADERTVRARQFVASTLDVHQTFEDDDRPRATAGGFPPQARRLQIHAVVALRPASCAARKPALRGGRFRSQYRPCAQMEHRRRHDGRSCSPRIRTCRPGASPSSCSSAPDR